MLEGLPFQSSSVSIHLRDLTRQAQRLTHFTPACRPECRGWIEVNLGEKAQVRACRGRRSEGWGITLQYV